MESFFYLPSLELLLFMKYKKATPKEEIQMKYDYAKRLMSYE
jgi:hypothetical protein